jgi:hypothetical protein
VISFVNRSNKLPTMLRNYAKDAETTFRALAPIAKTRFSTIYDCLPPLSDARSLLRALSKDHPELINGENADTIEDDELFIEIAQMISFLRPIYELIKKSEASQFSPADCYLGCLLLLGNIRNLLTGGKLAAQTTRLISEKYLSRLSEILRQKIFLLAFSMDPRYLTLELSDEGMNDCIEALTRYAKDLKLSENLIPDIISAFRRFRHRLPPYDIPWQTDETAKSYWKILGLQKECCQPFVAIAIYLFSMSPHSMSCERTFSIMGWLNAPRRASMKIETLTMLTKVQF